MSPAAHAFAAYHAAEIETISQRDLIVRLYQGAESFLVQAQTAMQNRAPELAHINCTKAKGIFVELASTLNFEKGGEVADRLKALYVYFITRISEANLRKDPTLIASILPLVSSLRAAWQQVPDALADRGSIPPETQGHTFDMRS